MTISLFRRRKKYFKDPAKHNPDRRDDGRGDLGVHIREEGELAPI